MELEINQREIESLIEFHARDGMGYLETVYKRTRYLFLNNVSEEEINEYNELFERMFIGLDENIKKMKFYIEQLNEFRK